MCAWTGRSRAVLAVLAANLACGASSDPAGSESAAWWYRTYSVSGTLSGLTGTLATSDALVLQDDGTSDLPLTDDGPFRFATRLRNGSAYRVTVSRQPPGYTCTVSGGDDGAGGGTIAWASVTSVAVSCSPDAGPPAQETVGGTIAGLSGTVVLRDNGGDDLTLASDGPFTFATPLADGSTYRVTVDTQPAGQTCAVSGGNDGQGGGTISGANVTSVTVTCAAGPSTGMFTVGGTISGGWGRIVLQDNGGDDLAVDAAGVTSFVFATPLADGASYSVAVVTPPAGRSCWVTNGTGTIGGTAVANVTVYCSTLYGQGVGCIVDATGLRTGWCADDGGCGGGPSPQCTGRAEGSVVRSVCSPLIETMPCQY